MKTKNKPKQKGFAESDLKHWEKSDGVNFAVALSRITGWMLQVDWLSPQENSPEKDLKPLRVYVETNGNTVFDFTGKRSVAAFNKYVILPIGSKRTKTGRDHIATRCYDEAGLKDLPLREQPSEYEIQRAKEKILANTDFLAIIPERQNPEIPAYLASQFSHGNCIPFAAAIQDLTELPALGISVSRYHRDCMNQPGFCHAIIMHPDGLVEDSWGRQPLAEVLDRFYIEEYTMDEDIFKIHQERQKREFPIRYHNAYTAAKSILDSPQS